MATIDPLATSPGLSVQSLAPPSTDPMHMADPLGKPAVTSKPVFQGSGPYARYQLDPDYAQRKPERGQAALTRKQWRLMQERYHPIEDRVIQQLLNPFVNERLADQAGGLMEGQMTSAAEGTERNLRRYGRSLDSATRTALTRQQNMAREQAVAESENTTRRSLKDITTGLQGDFMQIGSGIAGQASSALGNAASMAGAREQAHDAAKSQHTQSLVSTGLGIAGLIASF